ncbi:MAG TPA: NAD(P)/FAD-dependent oxidoreductase [Anaerolineaceae bacterium]
MSKQSDNQIVDVAVVGAGIGGLAAAGALSWAGLRVVVLEAEAYAGGCAGTYFHKGYRFDAGATLAAGFYPGGPMDLVAKATGIASWSYQPTEPVMVVHLPDGSQVRRFSPQAPFPPEEQGMDAAAPAFWTWQRKTADALWDLALELPDFPPQGVRQWLRLARLGLGWLVKHAPQSPSLVLNMLFDAFGSAGRHLKGAGDALWTFVDAQLLIASQATSRETNALYAAAALDLPRRGAAQVQGGMGGVANALVEQVRRNGSQVLFKAEVTRIERQPGGLRLIRTRQKGDFRAQAVICNLPEENILRLTGKRPADPADPTRGIPPDGWGGFMLYLGVDGKVIPDGFPLHHQVVWGEPYGEGNTIFLSISPAWDASRAPSGKRAITISSHTRAEVWWRLFQDDPAAYQQRKEAYTRLILERIERVLPGIQNGLELVLPGTPVTFQRYTGRAGGWVGGYPQTSLFRMRPPKLEPGLWMVGDSIFPGQSMPAVALGGLRVAHQVLAALPQRIS